MPRGTPRRAITRLIHSPSHHWNLRVRADSPHRNHLEQAETDFESLLGGDAWRLRTRLHGAGSHAGHLSRACNPRACNPLSVLSFNLLGDALRDVLDPRTRKL